ncbi:carbohydrate ABC transporter permease [Nocardia sp. NRRL S-836]|uniref:carbohydrate ABC transporter permease n=1 Tax=Nocardia sp. NRRL S-836 TaxID=1519492 RepID=UPI0006AE6983|nr:carbohydrate ABC transporter permease [Nocardia sp. NRRL S-836]KOV90059.1 sugar ABC transporter permease [Nocardia sp. NRRL S-836]
MTTEPYRTPLGRRLSTPVKHVALVLIGFVMLYPVLWMVVSSLRPDDVIFRSPGLVLDGLRTENYAEGWNALTPSFGTYLLNSAVLVLGCIIGNLVSCSMAAYAFARLNFSGKRWWFGIMLGTIMLPIHVIIVPQYVLFSQIGWVNTFLPLIVPKVLATDAFFVFLMVQFIRGLPRELDEAARIDGCGHPRIFLRIILPLMKPALATTTIFTFIWTWNDFFGQLIYLTDPDMYTVPVALRSFVDSTVATSWGSQFAMSVVSLVPIFLAFLIGQRYLVQGIATTGGK